MTAHAFGHLPPGPDLTSDQSLDMERNPLNAFDRCHKRYGANFSVAVNGATSRVFLGAPDAIHKVLVGAGDDLESAGSTAFRSVVGEHSVVFLNGDEHLRTRRLLGWPLMGNQMRSRGLLIEQQAKVALTRVRGTGPVPLIELTRGMTLGVMVRLVFGDLSADRVAWASRLCADLLSSLNSDERPDPQRLRSLCASLDGFIAEEVAGARDLRERRGSDVVSHLLQNREDGDGSLSDQQIRGHVISLLVAGFETTAATLAWAAFLVASHPEVRDGLVAALRGLGDSPDPETIAAEPYLVATCKEALRLSSVVPTGLTRRTSSDVRAGGYVIPRGTEVVPCIHVAHRRADRYPEPERFDPLRFLGQHYGNAEYLPFGVGSRRCLGAAFASYELAIGLAVMFRTTGFDVLDRHYPGCGVAHGPTVAFPETVRAIVYENATDAPPCVQGSGGSEPTEHGTTDNEGGTL